jgi:uncharacterized protein YjaZ
MVILYLAGRMKNQVYRNIQSFLHISLYIIFILFIATKAVAQQTDHDYFQQTINLQIDVALDDVRHILRGHIRMSYQNNSQDELKRMPLHLWPNAYRSKETTLSEQLLRLGKTDLYNADLADLGRIDSLEFRVKGKKLAFSIDPEFKDIGWIRFSEPLLPGETIDIESPFRVKIPASFSRLGHVGQTYQVTQWFPKPAVYNLSGWQLLPYLDQGEFFSEFGDYNVNITLPANYVVAATGELITSEEKDFLYRRVKETQRLQTTTDIVVDTIPLSAGQQKTISFVAKNVHDFAWFADKRFRVDSSSVILPGGRKVETWTYYTKTESEFWKNATSYLNRSIQFYSEAVGEYEWPQVSAVQSPLSAGVGMEYPMITLIGPSFSAYSLDQVITHEVGHNWFYGMLASNERKYAWMDEGLNTFFEYAYEKKYYNQYGSKFIPEFLTKHSDMRDEQALYADLVRQQKLDPGKMETTDQNGLSYYLNAYEIPEKGFELLQRYMGENQFREAVQSYFEKWKFRHPSPADFQQIFESYCDCDLTWLITDLLQEGGYINYSAQKFEGNDVVIENQGTVKAPVELIVYDDAGKKKSKWIEGFDGTISVPLLEKKVSHVQLYESTSSLDIDWSNNYLGKSGLFPSKRPFKIGFISGLDRSDRNQVFVFPALGINQADRGMIGVGLTNLRLPNPSFRWIAAPMYSIQAKNIVGMGEVRKDFSIRSGFADRLTLRGAIKRFSYQYDDHYGFIDQYDKLEGEAIIHFRKPQKYTSVDQSLSFRFANIHQRFGTGIDLENFLFAMEDRSYYVNELQYFRSNDYVLAPSSLKLTAHQGKGFLRLMGNYRQKMAYAEKSKGLFVHLFGGLLAQNDNPDANVNFILNGQASSNIFTKDYMYDEILFGRNASKGILSQQVFLRDAELKTLSNVGVSDSWMVGAGVSSSLPLPLPFHLYADFAFYNDPFESKVQFSYSSGFAIVIQKDFFEIYFPLFESQDIRESITYQSRQHDSYLEKISFMINLKKLHPFDAADHFFEFLY